MGKFIVLIAVLIMPLTSWAVEIRGEAIVIDNRGVATVAGQAGSGMTADVFVKRFSVTEGYDADSAKSAPVIDLGGEEAVYGIAADTRGGIMLAGYSRQKGQKVFFLIKIRSDGALDTGFGDQGKVLTSFDGDAEAHFMARQSDGKFVLAGFVDMHSGSRIALARYLPDGRPDTTFGADGRVVTRLSSNDRAYAVAVDQKKRIVITGSTRDGNGGDDCVVVRYLPNGKVDSDFGKNGGVQIRTSERQDMCSSIGLLQDGRIIVAGFSDQGKTQTDFIVTRLTGDGRLDQSFGDNGRFVADYNRGFDIAHALAVDKKGRILVAGDVALKATASPAYNNGRMGLLRLLPSGKIDTAFGKNGWHLSPENSRKEASAEAMALDPTGRVFLTGYAGRKLGIAEVVGD